jgi:DNA-binding LytR/AlgR family response regulator
MTDDVKKTNAFDGTPSKPYLFFNADKKQVRVWLEEILFIESQKDYLKIVSKNKTIITRQTMQEIEQTLPSEFQRVHRSYIVSIKAIDAFDASQVEVAGQKIPIGRLYQKQVFMKLKKQPGD